MARIVPPYPAMRRQFTTSRLVTSESALFMGGCFTCDSGGGTSVIVKAFNGTDNTGTLVFEETILTGNAVNINYGGGVHCGSGLFVEVTAVSSGTQQGTIFAHWNE
jgi:hypothetical protein